MLNNLKKYKSIIFDLDGTLIDSEKRNVIGLQKVLREKANKEVDLETLSTKMGHTGANILKEFDIPDEEIQDYLNEWLKVIYHHSQQPAKIFQGIDELLLELKKRNVTCGIVSSKPRQLYQLENFSHHEQFAFIVLSDDTPFHKPHPAPLLQYLELSQSPPQECLYIGDTYSDFLCARDSNIDFGLATWGATSLLENENIYRFSTPKDILEFVH